MSPDERIGDPKRLHNVNNPALHSQVQVILIFTDFVTDDLSDWSHNAFAIANMVFAGRFCDHKI